MNIEQLRKSRKADFGKIVKEFENTTNKPYQDDRFWKPERDKAGNATATIRFLNAGPDDELPWVKIFSHGFQGPSGRWYIENSLTTLGKPDPVAEYNVALWNSTSDDNSPERKRVRDQKRKLSYISNVLVVSDPKHPENNGKVFLYKYGKKIFEQLKEAISPAFEDEQAINPFDLREGANFKIKIRKVDGYWNYDKSEFDSVSPLFTDENKLNGIYTSLHSLSEIIAPSEFKSYEELKEKLDRVLGLSGAVSTSTAESVAEDFDEVPWSNVNSAVADEPVVPSVDSSLDEDSDDDAMDYFKKLAES